MSKKQKWRGNSQIAKYTEQIATAEKGLSHRKLKARALCTHTKEPFTPALSYREENGKVVWVCKICGEKIDLNRISDEKLNEAINTINQACNTIKMMSSDSDKDKRLVEEVIADLQLKANAYLAQAYKAALNSSAKQNNRKNRQNRSRVSWGE